jgi:AcrR family transcriptional regulator
LAIIDVLERHFPGHRAQLKRHILLHALACFNEHGLEATTIDMIKQRCETSVGNIYHHFGNKDGLIAELFFCGVEDYLQLLTRYLERAQTAREGVAAVVHSYVDWVAAQPDLARFQLAAGSAVAKGPRAEDLAAHNQKRNLTLIKWLTHPAHQADLAWCPRELLPSLLIGHAESYCRAWLSGKVKSPPTKHRDLLAAVAWRAVTMGSDAGGRPAG